jgi:hypothetical protein
MSRKGFERMQNESVKDRGLERWKEQGYDGKY